MWLTGTLIAVGVILVANYTRRQWPGAIFDGLIYLACGVIVLDYLL